MPGESPAPDPPGWRLIGRGLRRRRGRLGTLAAWSVLEALPTTLSGLLVTRAVDDGFLSGSAVTGLAWLAALLAAYGAGALASRFTFPAVGSLVEPLRDDLLRGVVDGAVRTGSVRGPGRGRIPDGASVSQVSQQVETVRRTSAAMLNGLRRFAFTVGATALGLAALDPRILWLVLPPLLASVALFGLLLVTLVRRQREAIERNEATAGAIGDALAGGRDITAFRARHRVVDDVTVTLREERAAQLRLAAATAVRSLIVAAGTYLPLLFVLLATPGLLDDGVSAGTVLGAITYLGVNIEPAMRMLTDVLGGSGLQLAVTLRRLADAHPGPEPPASPEPPAPGGGELHLEGVGYAYGADAEPVIHDLSLTIRDGSHLAVVGPSGIGKSTLAELLSGGLGPARGRIHVGGLPPDTLSRRQRAALVALMPQEAYVFSGSVRCNLNYLRPDGAGAEGGEATENGEDAEDAALRRAVREVGAADLVRRLGGLDAPVDPAALSQGERQLLALARVYAGPARITILDEATCHLDPAAEARAEHAFRRRPGTLIVVAHRLSSALRADRVLVLDGPRSHAGTHEQLLAASALYVDLVGHWNVSTAEGPAQAGR
ncbi:ABC transporter ATP-binding protein [Streptomyces sp. WMMC500]|uniref:ATP-binding cassette domain-containing protein n=1 Tax=Streptomyces sp. WMMC500 TaxID=3015154 RepID=UPI00248AE392|nr:ABC transporter ATP-binding protein [Streptomyces sp. WMMC500]WBB58435.1 ABC transporter ATP-binding protein [Streptomyces sp. WMMC500]